ncbi:hypothetical protein MKW94_008322 [Papaver nudicaule]|uniref:Multidrug resistance protein ABC transporter family protein n=1 Tax=Papaver nudicaule TaxID=74823 RepID=A0AA41RV55_PAPNU|nr:hypothetical protein [Papaver nudicaule]
MGNFMSSKSPDAPAAKVVLPDGTVHEFNQPLTVAELMLDHPQQVVVEIESIESTKRPIPLPADKKLEMKKFYLMLPMKQGKAASFSTDDARRILMKIKPDQRLPNLLCAAKIIRLFARICQCGIGNQAILQRRDSLLQEESEKKRNVENDTSKLPRIQLEIFCERPAFLGKQVSMGKGWTPSLVTIEEKTHEKKILRRLFHV